MAWYDNPFISRINDPPMRRSFGNPIGRIDDPQLTPRFGGFNPPPPRPVGPGFGPPFMGPRPPISHIDDPRLPRFGGINLPPRPVGRIDDPVMTRRQPQPVGRIDDPFLNYLPRRR